MKNDSQPPAHFDHKVGTGNYGGARLPRFSGGLTVKRAKPTGHAALLEAIEKDKTEVTIDLLDDPNPLVGYIKCSDKYTISLKVYNPDGTYRVYVIFKHAIRMFWTAPRFAQNNETEAVH